MSEELETGSEEPTPSTDSDAGGSGNDPLNTGGDSSVSSAAPSPAEDWKARHEEAQRLIGRQGSELARLREIERQQRQQTQNSDPAEAIRKFAERVKQNPIEAIREITKPDYERLEQETKQTRFESAYNQARSNPEFVELEPVMTQIAQEFEGAIAGTSLQHDPRILNLLFVAAKGLKASDMAQKAKAQGQKEGEMAASKKTRLQVESGSSSKGRSVKDFDSLSRDEMRKEILKGNLG